MCVCVREREREREYAVEISPYFTLPPVLSARRFLCGPKLHLVWIAMGGKEREEGRPSRKLSMFSSFARISQRGLEIGLFSLFKGA